MTKNWIDQPNPFNLPAPPEWWLRVLAELHPRIVLFAGMSDMVYRVGERTAATRILTIAKPDSEAGRMLKHGCIPLVSLVPTIEWNQDFLEWLDRHDAWALKGKQEGSGAAAADRLDEIDRLRQAQLDRQQADESDQRGSSAYFALAARMGSLAFLSGDHRRTDNSRQPTAPPDGGPRD